MAELDTLKVYLEKLIEIDDEEKKYKEYMETIKREKENLNQNIINIIEKNKIMDKDIIINNKQIKYATQKIQDGITKKLILERLKIYFNDDKRAIEATDFIYKNRDTTLKKLIKISDKNT